jgi:hypothetical protein
MTLTNEVQDPSGLTTSDPQPSTFVVDAMEAPRLGRSSPGEFAEPIYELGGLGFLLEDPVMARWADEAANRYGVAPLDALDALAEALRRDAIR